jgi:predicted nucleic acid-binding protein
MSLRVVLDADVIVRMPVCDTMLRLAEAEVFDVVWSDRILDEVRDALISSLGIRVDRAEHRIKIMRDAFPSALVHADAVDGLEPIMANATEDRHVLAAAVAGDAQVVVTFNVRDFPRETCEPFGIEAMHPDHFLLMQLSLDASGVRRAIGIQATELSRPPMTLDAVLDTLHTFVPRFVDTFRAPPLN